MNKEQKYQYFYEYLLKIQSIAKIGKLFSKDPYALKNYDEIERLTMDELNRFANLNFDRPNYFSRDVYPTPNVSVRCVILKNDEVLLVKEIKEQAYSLPGGWCDLYETPLEAIERECIEEAGVKLENIELIGLYSRMPSDEKEGAKNINCVPEYQLTFKANVKEYVRKEDLETDDVKFFKISSLPKLSNKVSEETWNKIFENLKSNKIYCD